MIEEFYLLNFDFADNLVGHKDFGLDSVDFLDLGWESMQVSNEIAYLDSS